VAARDATPALEVRQLSVDVHGIRAVHDVSLTVGAGERVGIIGESGCGKTVTALAVMGLLPRGLTASGSVRLDGQELLTRSERQRARIRGDRMSMIFQEPMTALDPLMTVGDQVAEPLRLHRGRSTRVARRQVVELLERVRLGDVQDKLHAYPHQLSGGQRQRILIAMALACDPDLVIADEPTTALDVTVQAQVLELLDELVRDQGAGLMLITHDLAVVASMSERVVVMYGGHVVETGPTGKVFGAPRHPYTRGLVDAVLDVDHQGEQQQVAGIPGVVPALGRFPSGCVFRDRCPRATQRCEQEPVLESGDHAVACWHPIGAALETVP